MDSVSGDPNSGLTEKRVTTFGFDLSVLDLWTAGTLANNISFQVLPSSCSTGVFHFEAAWIPFDKLLKSRWVNLKFGKHELDTPISEKRFLTLTANGGFFQLYHPVPVGEINSFTGIGNNQLGAELMGHSANSYTRYAVSVLSSNSGDVGLPTNRSYDAYGDFSQAFELPKLGLQRSHTLPRGRRAGCPVRFPESPRRPPGKLDVSTLFMHGNDNVLLGTGAPANQTDALPEGAQGPTWNGGFVEAQLTVSPQLVLVSRYESIRMSRQALPAGTPLANGVPLASNFGNTDAVVLGYRWYPIMSARAGIALHQEYAHVRTCGMAPVRKKSATIGWIVASAFLVQPILHAAKAGAADASHGKPLYRRYCIGCHGPNGDGMGENGVYLDPRPRDFTAGTFKCRSTLPGTLPVDNDLLTTIGRGIYASGMPPWRALTEQQPANDQESISRGNQIYQRMESWKCHGKEGRGNGPSSPTPTDSKERPIIPYDFTRESRFNSGQTNADLYRIFMTGLDGTPMSSYMDQLKPLEAWDLVHYLRTLRAKVKK